MEHSQGEVDGQKLAPKVILQMPELTRMTDTLTTRMKHPLGHFMEQHRTEDKSKITMTGLGDVKGRWHISDDDYPQFLDHLYDYLFVQKNRALGLAEQPTNDNPKPLLIDLDFKYPENKSTAGHLFTDEQIVEFCEVLKEAMRRFFDLNEYSAIRFFVLLRPSAYKQKDVIKDGIHIESPDFTLTNDKWNVLRQWILQSGAIRRIFGSTGYTNVESDIFDPAMGRKQGWMFYGESKPSISPYRLEFVRSYDPERNDWSDDTVNEDGDSTYTPRDLMEILSIRYKVSEQCGDVLPERRDEFDALLQSFRGGGAVPAVAPRSPPLTGAQGQHPELDVPANTSLQTMQALLSSLPYTDETRILVGRLVRECLSVERSTDHDNWMRVGWCLHNLEPSEEMFTLWIDFTKKSPKWDHHRHSEYPQLRREWFRGMRKEGDGPRLTLRSLHKWARDDNREQYDLIMNEDILEYIISKVVNNTHYHVAQLMQRMFQTTYVASIGQRATEWFLYDEILNMWKHLNQGIDLKRKICFDVAKRVDDACGRVRDKIKLAKTTEDMERGAKKLEDLYALQSKLYNVGFLDSVMKMASIFFAEEDFVKKLNLNPYLVGCSNGILELRYQETPTSRPRVLFRQGKAEDYVSFLAGRIEAELEPIAYKPFDPNDPNLPEIYDFFEKLFPNAELRRYVMKLLASTLEGANPEQCYYIFSGRGSNGKSKLMDLMTFTLGDYITSIQSTVLTRKRPDSGAANPDIIVTKNKRFIYMQEPDAKEPLNTSRMKQFSGEDLVEARPLFGDQEKFKIMGKLFMMCNDLPPIYSMDNGTWRRIRVVPFESTFRSPEHADWKLNKPNLFVKDENLGLKLKKWRESFFSLLVHIYETEYLVTGLHPEPAVVLQASDKYKADFDTFARFKSERIRREDGNRVDFKDIVKIFKRWCQENGMKKGLTETELWNRVLDASDINKFDERKKILMHIRLFSTDEEVEDYDNQNESEEE